MVMTGSAKHDKYLTSKYEAAITEFIDAHPEKNLSSEAVGDAYIEACRQFEDQFTDDTPLEAIRRVAFRQMKTRFD